MEGVLVAELLYPKGHRALNEKYLKCISKNYEITLIDDGTYFSSVESDVIAERIILPRRKVKRVELLKTLCYANYLAKIAKVAKDKKLNNIILLSFHTEAFGMVSQKFDGLNVCVVHHYEIDRMYRRLKEMKSFEKYKNTISHCVLEDFIATGLVNEFGISQQRVFVVRIPLNPCSCDREMHEQNHFVGIGQSMDISLINELVMLDKQEYQDTTCKGRITLRAKELEYRGKCVEVFTGYLSAEAYDKLYRSATACIVKYDGSYRLRSSGSIADAFINHKKVIVTDFPAGACYAAMYPHNCIQVRSAKDIMELLNCEIGDYDLDEGLGFEHDHSFEQVSIQWKHAIDASKRLL